MRAGETDLKQAVWSSESGRENVEHIFFKLPRETKNYELWVRQAFDVGADYALAWWTIGVPTPPGASGKVDGRIWHDLDRDGVQGGSEPGIAYARVDLYDASDAWVDTTTTLESGYYVFNSLPAGTYYVQFTNPVGYGFTTPNMSTNDTLDSDAGLDGKTDIFTIVSSETVTRDAGLVTVPPGVIGGSVWGDTDEDGAQDESGTGIANVVVYLYDAEGRAIDLTTTDSAGNYEFAPVHPGDYSLRFESPYGYVFTLQGQGGGMIDSDADPTTGQTAPFTVSSGQTVTHVDAGLVQVGSVGDYVWEDDGDGVQGAEEFGLEGVLVELHDSAGGFIGSSVTDYQGYYYFGDLRAGSYYLTFHRPSGYNFAPKDQGSNDASDSDSDPVTGQTAVFMLTAGEVEDSIDTGLVASGGIGTATVGDYVFEDEDGDGVQDPFEYGVSGVPVHLHDAFGTLVGSAGTDIGGYYEFRHLAAGDYYVAFEKPAGYGFTARDQGADDALDSDAGLLGGQTAGFTVGAGAVITSIDAGLVALGSVGDYVRGAHFQPIEENLRSPSILLPLLTSCGSGSSSRRASAYQEASSSWGTKF